ncbi:MAG TPA: hypothetical protein VE954_18980 [Oligoflexus sp.]|uniref:hypothetical protein n=1 Tax=Oligoflexus sp. TaxID=1971216 RepID=UPI002D250767|nr:hypothetical protein [Oligoflexus sp.]HYX35185.1 hypothetical protein [Oligoflexus sp.]
MRQNANQLCYFSAIVFLLSSGPGVQAANKEMDQLRALLAIQQGEIASLQEKLKVPRFVGTSDLPIDFKDAVGPAWKRLQMGWGQTHAAEFDEAVDPGRKLQARVCLMWSDGCTAGSFSIKLVPGAGEADVSPQDSKTPVYSADGFGFTWSDHKLFHTRCGPWIDARPMLEQCGGGWGGTCQLMNRRDQQTCQTTINRGHIEWRSLPVSR